MADKLGMALDIYPMPLARRIKQFENGKLDILVGLIKRKRNEEKLIYLEPVYEKLPVGFFVLQENQDQLAHESWSQTIDDIVLKPHVQFSHISQQTFPGQELSPYTALK